MDGSYVNVAESSLETSQFSTAVFHNVSESYPLADGLPCEFSVNDLPEKFVDNGCWIGLFRVGWETISDCLCKHTVTLEDGEQLNSPNNRTITALLDLSHCTLSAEEEEFYQFCFVDSTGEIRGASCPFQLRSVQAIENPSTENVEWWFDLNSQSPVEDIDDAVLVHNKTTLLEESVARLAEENASLKANKGIGEGKLKEIEEVVQGLEIRKADLTRELTEKDALLSGTMDELSTVRGQLELERRNHIAADTKAAVKTQEVRDLELSIASSEQLVADLADKIKSEEDKRMLLISSHDGVVSSLQLTIAELRTAMENSSYSETILKEQFDSEVSSFTKMYEKLQVECQTKQDLLEGLIQEKEKITYLLSCCKSDMQKLKDEFAKEKTVLEGRLKEAVKLGDDLGAIADQQSNEMQLRINQLDKALCECKAERDVYNKEAKDSAIVASNLQDKLVAVNITLQSSDAELSDLKQQTSNRDKEIKTLQTQSRFSTGSNHALRIACSHMQKQISQLKQKNGDSHSEGNSAAPSENENLKEVEELKLRLCMGANAYRSKVVECKKLKERINELTAETRESSTQESAEGVASTSRSDVEIQTSQCTQEDLDAAREHCKKLEAEYKSSKSEHENVVSVLLLEIQKLAEKVEAAKKPGVDSKEGSRRASSFPETKQTSETSTKLRLKDLAEQAPDVKLGAAYAPTFQPGSTSSSRPTYNFNFVSPPEPVAPVRKVMQHSRSVDSPDDAPLTAFHRTVRRYGSEPVVFCPVCGMHFPQSFTDKAATEHVNAHFI